MSERATPETDMETHREMHTLMNDEHIHGDQLPTESTMDAPRRSMERLVRLAAWNGRTSPAHTKDWKQVCPACGGEVKTQGPHYWEARRNGEDVSPVTRVYCSNKCRQKGYRLRRALKRNAGKSRLPNAERIHGANNLKP